MCGAPRGSGAPCCPEGGFRQVCQGPRTVQSEETEIPSLAEQRKLKTKCFFLKSRKEAASVEFLDGAHGEELPPPWARGGGDGPPWAPAAGGAGVLECGLPACPPPPGRARGPWRLCSPRGRPTRSLTGASWQPEPRPPGPSLDSRVCQAVFPRVRPPPPTLALLGACSWRNSDSPPWALGPHLPDLLRPYQVSPIVGMITATLILILVPATKRGHADQLGGQLKVRTSWLRDMKALIRK